MEQAENLQNTSKAGYTAGESTWKKRIGYGVGELGCNLVFSTMAYVSYTHLDVYKRQGQNGWCGAMTRFSLMPAIHRNIICGHFPESQRRWRVIQSGW